MASVSAIQAQLESHNESFRAIMLCLGQRLVAVESELRLLKNEQRQGQTSNGLFDSFMLETNTKIQQNQEQIQNIHKQVQDSFDESQSKTQQEIDQLSQRIEGNNSYFDQRLTELEVMAKRTYPSADKLKVEEHLAINESQLKIVPTNVKTDDHLHSTSMLQLDAVSHRQEVENNVLKLRDEVRKAAKRCESENQTDLHNDYLGVFSNLQDLLDKSAPHSYHNFQINPVTYSDILINLILKTLVIFNKGAKMEIGQKRFAKLIGRVTVLEQALVKLNERDAKSIDERNNLNSSIVNSPVFSNLLKDSMCRLAGEQDLQRPQPCLSIKYNASEIPHLRLSLLELSRNLNVLRQVCNHLNYDSLHGIMGVIEQANICYSKINESRINMNDFSNSLKKLIQLIYNFLKDSNSKNRRGQHAEIISNSGEILQTIKEFSNSIFVLSRNSGQCNISQKPSDINLELQCYNDQLSSVKQDVCDIQQILKGIENSKDLTIRKHYTQSDVSRKPVKKASTARRESATDFGYESAKAWRQQYDREIVVLKEQLNLLQRECVTSLTLRSIKKKIDSKVDKSYVDGLISLISSCKNQAKLGPSLDTEGLGKPLIYEEENSIRCTEQQDLGNCTLRRSATASEFETTPGISFINGSHASNSLPPVQSHTSLDPSDEDFITKRSDKFGLKAVGNSYSMNKRSSSLECRSVPKLHRLKSSSPMKTKKSRKPTVKEDRSAENQDAER